MRRAPVRSFPWSRVVGLGLVALAVVLALDPDYPVARGGPGPAARVPGPAPAALVPRGECARGELVFRWSWPGPAERFELTVLSEALEPLWSVRCGPQTRHAPAADSELHALLSPGRAYLWSVRVLGAAGSPRTSPLLFRVKA